MTEASQGTLPTALYQLIVSVLARADEGDCSSLARMTASEIFAYFGARAVSIISVAGAVIQARAGEFPVAAQNKVDNWERALVRTVRQGSTNLTDATIPVASVRGEGWTACMVPLVAGRRVVGALSVCVESAPDEDAIRAAQTLSPWVGAILSLAQTTETIKCQSAARVPDGVLRSPDVDVNERIARMQRSLRTEIAGAMHQGAIQLLAAVAMGLDHLEHLAAARPDALPDEIKSLKSLTREAAREARLLLAELNPVSLAIGGLKDALENYIQQMPGGGQNIHFASRGSVEEVDPTAARIAFHSVVRGLRHAHSHGNAEHIWLLLLLEDEMLSIEIEDDGVPQASRRCSRHDQELDCAAYIRQELELAQGTLTVRAETDQTRPALLIRIPARAR